MGYISDDTRKVTTHRLIEMKQRGEKISMLTSYDYTMAQIVDGAGVDVILVGDSASNVMAGNGPHLLLPEIIGIVHRNRGHPQLGCSLNGHQGVLKQPGFFHGRAKKPLRQQKYIRLILAFSNIAAGQDGLKMVAKAKALQNQMHKTGLCG